MILQQSSLNKVRIKLKVGLSEKNPFAGCDLASVFEPFATRELIKEAVVVGPNIHPRRRTPLQGLKAPEHDEKMLNALRARPTSFDPTTRIQIIGDPNGKVAVFGGQLELRDKASEKFCQRNNHRYWQTGQSTNRIVEDVDKRLDPEVHSFSAPKVDPRCSRRSGVEAVHQGFPAAARVVRDSFKRRK